MCGICGIVGSLSSEEQRRRVAAMASAMRHRGPDDEGFCFADDIALGMRRLSIIDLYTGHQPIFNEDNSICIVSNGEIYNFQTLRAELEEHGHRFATRTDTEVIVHLYEERGLECVHKLRGMFAFAIWDAGRRRLFLARDRLGIKPLYYAHLPGKFLFASEVRAMLASGLIERRVSLPALDCYLAYGSIAPPHCIVEGVQALPAGHWMTVDESGNRLTQYWDVSFEARPELKHLPRNEAVHRLRQLLKEALQLRLVSDVPLGVFLSGGIDSSAVVGLMAELGHHPIRTFSIGFEQEGRRLDERSYARSVARRFGTEHTERIVTGEDVRNELRRIIRGLDQPSYDGVNSYLVSQVARQQVTVALSGLGGDELFAGYPQFKRVPALMRRAQQWRSLPATVRDGAVFLTQHLPGALVRRTPLQDVSLLVTNPRDFLDFYAPFRTIFSPSERRRLLTSDVRHALSGDQAVDEVLASQMGPSQLETVHQIGRLEMKTYMAATLLRDTDAMSMVHSLEARVPLLDHVLVEFVTSLPAVWKVDSHVPKPLLVEALADMLPAEMIHRRKMGFELPMGRWLRGPLRQVMEAALDPAITAAWGLLDAQEARACWENFLVDEKASYKHVWMLAVLNLWLEEVFAATPTNAGGDGTPWLRQLLPRLV